MRTGLMVLASAAALAVALPAAAKSSAPKPAVVTAFDSNATADAATPKPLTPSEAVGENSPFSLAQRSDLDPAERIALVAEALPEPVSWAMMVIGFGGLGAVLRQRRRKARLAA